jgi:hypothetical protein
MTGGAVVIRLAPMVAVATMGTPRVMIRECVTMEHLWTARHAARQCREREAQVLHQETPDTERRS